MENKTKLLIIDDEEIVHKSCSRILRRAEDIEADFAYNGEEGLEKLSQKEYDIVLCDLMMPGIGGMEVLERLVKEHPEVTPIIFTGYATVETARQALKQGAFDYIPKPFTPDELLSVLNAAIEKRRAQKEKKSQVLDLMALVSHDLKSPIAVVHGSAETLYKGYFGDLAPEQRKTLEGIIRNCSYLEDIIRSYLDLSEMGLNEIGTLKERIHLIEDVIEPVVQAPEHQQNFRRMRLVTDYRSRPEIEADPSLLKVVMTNLISNAIKYGRPETDILVRVEEPDGSVRVSVRNEGVGLTEEDIRSRLFKRHSRLKQKGTEGVKGSGLGLYICRTVVEKHGGRIWAESEPGEWAEFSFELPLESAPE